MDATCIMFLDGVLPEGVGGRLFGVSTVTTAKVSTQLDADATVAIDRFGLSAPGSVSMEKFDFAADHVAQKARELLGTRA